MSGGEMLKRLVPNVGCYSTEEEKKEKKVV